MEFICRFVISERRGLVDSRIDGPRSFAHEAHRHQTASEVEVRVGLIRIGRQRLLHVSRSCLMLIATSVLHADGVEAEGVGWITLQHPPQLFETIVGHASQSFLRTKYAASMRICQAILLLVGATVVQACTTSWKAPVSTRPAIEAIRVEHQTGGTHRAAVVAGPVWYQLTGVDLLVLDNQGRQISRLPLANAGTSSAAQDIEVIDDRMAVLLGDSEVVLLDVDDPWRPQITDRVDARELGLWPTSLGTLDGSFLAMGHGAARLLDGDVVIRSDGGEVTSVVDHDGRLLYVADRRVHRRAGDTYLGTASLLKPAMESRYLPRGSLLFARHERTGSLVGFLGPDCRELDTSVWTTGIPGTVHTLDQWDGRVLVASDEGVFVLAETSDGLAHVWSWPRSGVHSAAWVDGSRLAVAGSFGRGIVRIGAVEPESTAVGWLSAPAGLKRAMSDGDTIIAESIHGHWSYMVGREPERIPTPGVQVAPPRQSAAVLGWSVDIGEDGAVTMSTPSGPQTLIAPRNGRFHCVAATEDAFWLGHDHGITVILIGSGDGEGEQVNLPRRLGVLLDGPVVCIEPLMLGGGVVYAAEHGGFGVVREVYGASAQVQRPDTR